MLAQSSSCVGVLSICSFYNTSHFALLQAGDLVLHINGESIQGLTHAQVVERIRTGGPRLHLVLSRPLETHPGKPEGVGGPQKGDGGFPDGEE